ncbi:MAG TPA: glycosyltransferase 87 family protein [Anaerolineales bacterium]
MNSRFKKIVEKSVVILIAVNILVGLFTFQDFGLTWDEPLFYSYGDALGYAYSPNEWFSGEYDLYNSYGSSGDDHKNRGPAYLLLARNFVYGLEALGSDPIPAWHLVNFIFFQLGIYFLYRLSTRWMGKSAAFFTTIFFSTQPLLWGHAFINPKDPPFLTFFLASICLGFEMVDSITEDKKDKTKKTILASFFLGIATSIRILGPFAGLLVFIYFIFRQKNKKIIPAWRSFIAYGVIAILVMIVTWPYLWENPVRNFFGVLRFMSDNPTQLGLLYEGVLHRANDLPLRYFPFMLGTTLTEPAIPLFFFGMIVAVWMFVKNHPLNHPLGSSRGDEKYRDPFVSLSLALTWFLVLIAYVLIRRPSMYDGIRHFLFILPPVFIFIGLAFQFIMDLINKWIKPPFSAWLLTGLGLILIVPGIYGIIKLHPYQYTYYNFYIGGTNGAYRTYETDYWLTCYKDAVEKLNELTDAPVNLFVKREAYLAAPFANDNIRVRELLDGRDEIQSGDYVLSNSRTNDDMSTFPNAPVVVEISRVGVKFCTIRQIP